MRTEEDLRIELAGLAARAPDPAPVLAAVQHRVSPRRRRRVAAARVSGTLVAAAVGAAAIVTVLPDGAPAGGGLTSARSILLTAAVSASKQTQTGRYWYTSVLQYEPGAPAHYSRYFFGSGRVWWRTDTWVPRSPHAESWSAEYRLRGPSSRAHPVFGYPATASAYIPWTMTLRQLERLPSSPRQLAVVLRQAMRKWFGRHLSPASVNAELFRNAFVLLGDPVSPLVRAAVFRLLARLPGVTAIGSARDALGRRGYAVALTGPAFPYWQFGVQRQVLVIDPATGTALEYEAREIRGDSSSGSVRIIKVLVSASWTDRCGPLLALLRAHVIPPLTPAQAAGLKAAGC